MGTVAFPDAELKFFLDASLETRAARRFEQGTSGSAGRRSSGTGNRDSWTANKPGGRLSKCGGRHLSGYFGLDHRRSL